MRSFQLVLFDLFRYAFYKRKAARAKTLTEMRGVFDLLVGKAPSKVRFESEAVGGVSGEWAKARGESAKGPVMFYLHGGGYIAMSPQTHRSATGGFARRGFRVFAPEYRLAPEHPYPAALDDAVSSYRALAAAEKGPIVLCGDSAGGGLAASLLLRLRDLGDRLPIAACFFSPWMDLTNSSPSLTENLSRDVTLGPLGAAGMDAMARAYAAGADLRDPGVSPLFGSLTGLPPVIIFVGDGEILRDDAVRFAERARSDGVQVDLQVWPDVPHDWPLIQGILPEGRRAFDLAVKFLMGRASVAATAPASA